MNDAKQARDLWRLNAVIDGLWMLDTVGTDMPFKAHFVPYKRDSKAVWDHLGGFCGVAGKILAHVEPLLEDDLGALRMYQLTIKAVRWYDSMTDDIAPVEVPEQVQLALIAAATYQLALREAGAISVELEDVTNHVWRLCFGNDLSRSVLGRMDE